MQIELSAIRWTTAARELIMGMVDPDRGGAHCSVTGDLPAKPYNSVCLRLRSEGDLDESISRGSAVRQDILEGGRA